MIFDHFGNFCRSGKTAFSTHLEPKLLICIGLKPFPLGFLTSTTLVSNRLAFYRASVTIFSLSLVSLTFLAKIGCIPSGPAADSLTQAKFSTIFSVIVLLKSSASTSYSDLHSYTSFPVAYFILSMVSYMCSFSFIIGFPFDFVSVG